MSADPSGFSERTSTAAEEAARPATSSDIDDIVALAAALRVQMSAERGGPLWDAHDALVVPNWTWRRYVNRSKREPAILINLSDSPILSAFGFYREEDEASPYAPSQALRPAAE